MAQCKAEKFVMVGNLKQCLGHGRREDAGRLQFELCEHQICMGMAVMCAVVTVMCSVSNFDNEFVWRSFGDDLETFGEAGSYSES